MTQTRFPCRRSIAAIVDTLKTPMNEVIQSLTKVGLSILFAMPAAAQSITQVNDKTFAIEPFPMPDEMKNKVDADYERDFMNRANAIVSARIRESDGTFKKKLDGRTFFESEKWSYPNAMMHVVGGNREAGLKVLQMEDSDAKKWHEHTLGIDLFPAFTLKGQVRKFYFFGPMLDSEYRQRMTNAIGLWTKTNPRATPHPVYQKFNPNIEGWTPERFGNLQSDSRNTDNLRAMRDIAIYLFADETDNAETKAWAEKELKRAIVAMYHVGMGEWDSETYHPHSFAAYLNLYDFAKDPEMRGLAKAALDHLIAAAALKYVNGGFAGPSKRDYGQAYRQFGGAFAKFFPLYFGRVKDYSQVSEWDTIHAITSNYRPPRAVLALANRSFKRPVEVLATKPTYENWKEGNGDRPETFETLYFGNTFQLGSAVSAGGNGDATAFRLAIHRGGDDLLVITANSRTKMNEKFAGDQIGQFRNLAIWLRQNDADTSFTFQVPNDIRREDADGFWFFQADKTWVAVRPINLGPAAEMKLPDEKAQASFEKNFPEATLLAAASSQTYSGFAIEVGEGVSFDEFKKRVRSKSKLEQTRDDTWRLTGANGEFVEMTYNAASDLPTLDRNGTVRDWTNKEEFDLWKTVGGDLISLGWQEGTLKINAGEHQFESAVSADGKARFSDR
jgi:hypothetical protein